jgi:hypothetical protein
MLPLPFARCARRSSPVRLLLLAALAVIALSLAPAASAARLAPTPNAVKVVGSVMMVDGEPFKVRGVGTN